MGEAEFSPKRLDDLWLYGGFPDAGILDSSAMPTWQLNYLSLLAQRDLPTWGLSAKPQLTARLFKMLTAAQGAIWNASMFGQSLGINYQTVNNYMDYLDGAFLIRRLNPYHANLKKRLIKSPKVYWRDTGLLHAQNNITQLNDLLAQPWVGASWEGFVIQQILSQITTNGIYCTPYYLRTSDQYEIDLLLDFGKELWACEIKLTTNPSAADMQHLNKTADFVAARRRFMISRVTTPIITNHSSSLDLHTFLNILKQDRN